ncbi:MAG TPA: type II toxin-antitoxin system Phd/YefM family antitoxin [Thermomicrobiales bacterium]|nr:type II toxin-antitoxin system Phd/YefM family antitoxin [Thermomicrobiales bacterium]
MNTIPAQEIKQRGISAVDKLLERGPVHVISRNRPRYVILDEATYEEMAEARHLAFVAESKAALAEVEAGNVKRYETTEELMSAIAAVGDDE